MASDTITTGLKSITRLAAKYGACAFARAWVWWSWANTPAFHPRCSQKLERDLMHPTLATLLRIAMVFSVGLEYFFNPEPKPVLEIVRKKDRLRFPDSQDAGKVAYHFESLDFPVPNRELNSYLADFRTGRRGARPPARTLGASNFSTFCPGKLELRTAEERHELGKATPFTSIPRIAWLPQNRLQAHRRAGGNAGARIKAAILSLRVVT
jgi:transcriptional regulator with XRE-family HTH domain